MKRTAWLIVLMLGACEAPPPASPSSASHNPNAPSITTDAPKANSLDPSTFSSMRMEQEALLHAAMYRTALESNVGGTNRFVLEPVQEEHPPALGAEPEQFRNRVLAELTDHLSTIGSTIEWRPLDWRTQDEPGRTYLIITILSRHEEQATVHGEICDRTPGSRSSRQGVTAVWDGARWHIERHPVRIVW